MTGIPRPPNPCGRTIRYTFPVDEDVWKTFCSRLDLHGSRARTLDWMIHIFNEYLKQLPDNGLTTDQLLAVNLPTLQLSHRQPDDP